MNPTVILRALCGFFLCSLLTAASAPAQDVSLVRVFPGWRDAASFKRISEYFTGRENTGGETILRTHPTQRAGFYFLVRLVNPGPARPAHFRLQTIAPGAQSPHTDTFPAELKPGSAAYHLGLTGPEWQNPKSQPVAWHLQILAADGRLLAEQKSYLWENPATR
jgi:hypothetical protein